MIKAASEHGYRAVTARQLSALAGVSTRTLYTLFPAGKQDCFLSAYDAVMQRTAQRVAAAYGSEREQRVRLACALDALARLVAEEPQAARLVLVEVFAAGPVALEHAQHAHRLFESMVNLDFRRAGGGAPPPPLLIKGIVAGIVRVAGVWLLNGRTEELPTLSEELLEWVLSYRSPPTAAFAPPSRSSRQATLIATPPESPTCDEDHDTRILRAAAQLAAQDGCASLSAARIAATAGVSWSSFDKRLRNPEQCMLEALDLLIGDALARATAAGRRGEDWPSCVCHALQALTLQAAGDEVFARLAFIEAFALGSAGAELRGRLLGQFADTLWQRAPASQRPTRLAAEASVGAVWGIIHDYVVRGSAAQLPRIARHLSYMVLAPAIGSTAATHALSARTSRARASS
ncbi:MAG TPA: TetR/AcrR family transcriptional regulator [Solirubrobacteraceae bacterium]|nr:TetR/AcrR family transcriptional regulator [Solirubrobacteraceae bacterium]